MFAFVRNIYLCLNSKCVFNLAGEAHFNLKRFSVVANVGTTSLDFLFVDNLSDVLFKFIHALTLYFTFKLRYITSF